MFINTKPFVTTSQAKELGFRLPIGSSCSALRPLEASISCHVTSILFFNVEPHEQSEIRTKKSNNNVAHRLNVQLRKTDCYRIDIRFLNRLTDWFCCLPRSFVP